METKEAFKSCVCVSVERGRAKESVAALVLFLNENAQLKEGRSNWYRKKKKKNSLAKVKEEKRKLDSSSLSLLSRRTSFRPLGASLSNRLIFSQTLFSALLKDVWYEELYISKPIDGRKSSITKLVRPMKTFVSSFFPV